MSTFGRAHEFSRCFGRTVSEITEVRNALAARRKDRDWLDGWVIRQHAVFRAAFPGELFVEAPNYISPEGRVARTRCCLVSSYSAAVFGAGYIRHDLGIGGRWLWCGLQHNCGGRHRRTLSGCGPW